MTLPYEDIAAVHIGETFPKHAEDGTLMIDPATGIAWLYKHGRWESPFSVQPRKPAPRRRAFILGLVLYALIAVFLACAVWLFAEPPIYQAGKEAGMRACLSGDMIFVPNLEGSEPQ